MRLDPANSRTLSSLCDRALSIDDLEMVVRDADQEWDSSARLIVKRLAIRQTVDKANQEGWTSELLTSIRDLAGCDPDLSSYCAELLQDVQRAALANGHAVDRPWTALVVNQRAFADREALRKAIWDYLRAQNCAPIMILTGASAAGKSHIFYLFVHLADYVPGTTIVRVDLTRLREARIGPREVFLELVTRLGIFDLPVTSDDLAQEARLAQKLVAALVGRFQDRGPPVRRIIVIDGLNLPTLSPGVFDFINELAIAVEQRDLPNFRLVLVGFDQSLPIAISVNVQSHAIETLTVNDAREFIDQLAKSVKFQLAPDQLQAFVDSLATVFAKPPGHIRMSEFERQLLAIRNSILL